MDEKDEKTSFLFIGRPLLVAKGNQNNAETIRLKPEFFILVVKCFTNKKARAYAGAGYRGIKHKKECSIDVGFD